MSIVLAVLLLLLSAAPLLRAARTAQPEEPSTYWDRLMEAQAARGMVLGSVLLQQERYDEAVGKLANAALQTPKDPKVHQLLGAAYYWSGRVDEAESEFRESLRLDEKDAQTHVLMGIVHAWRGRSRAAYASFRRAEELDPKRADIQMNLGSIEESLGDLPGALAHFRKAAEIEPTNPLYHFQLGMLYRRLGRDNDAIDSLEKALKRFPRYQDAMLELGAVYERAGRIKDAFEVFARAVKVKERDSVARFRAARAALALGKTRKAEHLLRGVFRLTPADRKSGLGLSVSYGGAGSPGGPTPGGAGEGREGSAAGEDAPAAEPTTPLDVLSRNLRRIPLDQAAELQVDLAFMEKPKLVRSRPRERGSLKRALEGAGKPQGPIQAVRREFSLPSGSPAEREQGIRDIMGELQSTMDAAPAGAETRMAMNLRFVEGVGAAGGRGSDSRAKVSFQPRDVGNDLGLWVVGTGWMALVEEALAEDWSAGPPRGGKEDASLWWLIEGIGYSTLGEAPKASECFKKALELDERSELAYLGRGVAMVIQGREAAAAGAFRKALEINPKNKSAADGLKWLLQEPAPSAQGERLRSGHDRPGPAGAQERER